MNVFLAGTSSRNPKHIKELLEIPFVLESFYSFQNWQDIQTKSCKKFFLDSGAFTFMNKCKDVDFNKYVDRYIEFINEKKSTIFSSWTLM